MDVALASWRGVGVTWRGVAAWRSVSWPCSDQRVEGWVCCGQRCSAQPRSTRLLENPEIRYTLIALVMGMPGLTAHRRTTTRPRSRRSEPAQPTQPFGLHFTSQRPAPRPRPGPAPERRRHYHHWYNRIGGRQPSFTNHRIGANKTFHMPSVIDPRDYIQSRDPLQHRADGRGRRILSNADMLYIQFFVLAQ